MDKIYKLKILIVGLTTVLALTNFNKNEFTKGIVKDQYSKF